MLSRLTPEQIIFLGKALYAIGCAVLIGALVLLASGGLLWPAILFVVGAPMILFGKLVREVREDVEREADLDYGEDILE